MNATVDMNDTTQDDAIAKGVSEANRLGLTYLATRIAARAVKPEEAIPPEAVLTAIREAFPKSATDILTRLRVHTGFDHFWSFELCGMFVGVEPDGYIHS